MPLTPDEEKRLRESVRSELEARLDRMQANKTQAQQDRRKNLEERIRLKIREEEEEAFFTEKGLVRYQNRYGEVEWLTPEEAEYRKSRRRSSKRSPSRTRKRRNRDIGRWIGTTAMVTVAVLAFAFLMKYNPRAGSSKFGRILINTDVPGAQVYLNGTERRQFTSPDTLQDVAPGVHFLSVYKEGYAAWPPMQRITVRANETATAAFTLKSAAVMGKVVIDANQPDYLLYVDGLPVRQRAGEPLEIPAGYRVISVVKKGFLPTPQHQRVLVKEQEVTRLSFDFQQSRDFGYLQVTSNRSSAYVYLDNHLTGIKANARDFAVPAGIYQVRVCENGFQSLPDVRLVEILPGMTHRLAFNLYEETAHDTVQIITRNPGAGLTVDGQWMGYVTPVLDLQLTEGSHFINLMRDGALYSEQDIYLDVNKLAEREMILDF